MTSPPKVGKIYEQSRIVSVKDFGVFVEITPGVEGLCHISELSDGYVKNVEDVCKMGDLIPVKLLAIDDQGRLRLSRKAALAEMGAKDQKHESKGEKPAEKDRRPAPKDRRPAQKDQKPTEKDQKPTEKDRGSAE